MINPKDAIRFTNVVSCKYSFHYSDFNNVMQDFVESIVAHNVNVKGPMFYSINNIPLDEEVNAEFFMPIHEDQISEQDGMNFHSYFSIEDMVSICIYANFEEHTEVAYAALIEYIEQNDLKMVTPIFHVVSGDETLQYIHIKIGVAQKELQELWK